MDISNGHLFGDTTLLKCDTGYEISGSSDTSMNISCNENGSWSQNDIICVRKGTIFQCNLSDYEILALLHLHVKHAIDFIS